MFWNFSFPCRISFRSPFFFFSLEKKKKTLFLKNLSRPILHGLCTLAYGVRAVINSEKAGASGDASLVRTVKGRMSSHVFPGETLRTEVWLLRKDELDSSPSSSSSSSSSSCSCSSCSSSSSSPPIKSYRKVVFVTSVVERGTKVITGAAVELGEPEKEEENEEKGEELRSRL